eukprot:jgi/Psemu1/284308/fgenesh1_pg.49_\
MSPINYGSIHTGTLSGKDVESWTSDEVASFLQSKDHIANYGAVFRSNRIDGTVAYRLTDRDLQSMGIDLIGDRHRILAALEDLKKAKEQTDRERILWVGHEELHWSWFDRAHRTWCGLCREDPEEYTLRFNYLDIQRTKTNRCCGIFTCCFGNSYHTDTIDLCNVDDVDVDGVPPPFLLECFCCAIPHEYVRINVSDHETHHPEGATVLKLKKHVGQEVKRKIQNQVEIMQKMERGS